MDDQYSQLSCQIRYNIACGQIDIGNAATEMTAKMATGVAQVRIYYSPFFLNHHRSSLFFLVLRCIRVKNVTFKNMHD